MDVLRKIEETKQRLDELIKNNEPFDKVLELSMKADELILEYYRQIKLNRA